MFRNFKIIPLNSADPPLYREGFKIEFEQIDMELESTSQHAFYMNLRDAHKFLHEMQIAIYDKLNRDEYGRCRACRKLPLEEHMLGCQHRPVSR